MKAYFKEEDIDLLTNRKDLKLLTVNSPTNINQTDKKKLEAFVNLVSSYSSTVKIFGTVLSGDLNRHYYNLLYKDKTQIKNVTLKIDLDFIKNFLVAMKIKEVSRGLALLLQQLAVDLGIIFERLVHHLGFNPDDLNAHILEAQANSSDELYKSPRGTKLKLMAWSSLRQYPEFNHYKQLLENYYNTDDRYKAVADPIIGGYAKKYFEKANKEKSINQQITFDECKVAAKNYLLEECAMIFVLETLDYHVATYPGALNDAIQYVYTNYLQSSMPWIDYKFNKGQANSPCTLFHSPNAILPLDNPLSEAIILRIRMYRLTEHSIRVKFLSAFMLFICQYNKLPVMDRNINPNISEEDVFSAIRLDIMLLGLNNESIRSNFYRSFMTFLHDFQQKLVTQQTEAANANTIIVDGPE